MRATKKYDGKQAEINQRLLEVPAVAFYHSSLGIPLQNWKNETNSWEVLGVLHAPSNPNFIRPAQFICGEAWCSFTALRTGKKPTMKRCNSPTMLVGVFATMFAAAWRPCVAFTLPTAHELAQRVLTLEQPWGFEAAAPTAARRLDRATIWTDAECVESYGADSVACPGHPADSWDPTKAIGADNRPCSLMNGTGTVANTTAFGPMTKGFRKGQAVCNCRRGYETPVDDPSSPCSVNWRTDPIGELWWIVKHVFQGSLFFYYGVLYPALVIYDLRAKMSWRKMLKVLQTQALGLAVVANLLRPSFFLFFLQNTLHFFFGPEGPARSAHKSFACL